MAHVSLLNVISALEGTLKDLFLPLSMNSEISMQNAVSDQRL